jgi:hypothetical protein
VVCCVAAGCATVVSCVVVVLVVAGSFTTVVHDVNIRATAGKAGIKMISFFIM